FASGRVVAGQVFGEPFVKLWIGSQRRLVKQPVAGTIVIGIGHFVDLRILEKLAPGLSVHSRSFYVDDKAVFDVDLGAREMARMVRRANDDTIGLGRRRTGI